MIHCEGLVKIYKASGVEVFALQGLDLDVEAGEMVAVIGNSGSGKSTLLNILGGLDTPSAGIARVGDWDLTKLTNPKRDQYRRKVVGFLWQNTSLNLTPYMSAIDNVLLAMARTGRPDPGEAARLLQLVGLGGRAEALPAELSGGEQQRIAVAAILAARPQVLLADEPTGSLDAASSHLVMQLLKQINQQLAMTVIMVTHDTAMTKYATRTVRIRDGKVATESTRGADEVAVLDSAGRVQLSGQVLAQTSIGRHVIVEVRDNAIVLRPPGQRTAVSEGGPAS